MPRKTKEQRAAYERERRAIPEVRDRKNAYAREYHKRYMKDPEVAARVRSVRYAWAQLNKEKRKAQAARSRIERRINTMIILAKRRARAKGWAFDLDQHLAELQRRLDAGVCEVTGYPFNVSPLAEKGVRNFDGPSFDRIDSTRGYTYDNVRIVLNIVNLACNTWGEEPLRKVMLHWLVKNK